MKKKPLDLINIFLSIQILEVIHQGMYTVSKEMILKGKNASCLVTCLDLLSMQYTTTNVNKQCA